MVFSSNVFLFAFFPVFLAVYLATPRRHRNLALLVAVCCSTLWEPAAMCCC